MHTLIIDALQAIFAQFPVFITRLQSDIVVAIKRGAHSNYNLALSAAGSDAARAIQTRETLLKQHQGHNDKSRRELFKRGNNFLNYRNLVMTNANANANSLVRG